MLSRYAAPPARKLVVPWTLLALAAIALAVAASAKPGTSAVMLVAVFASVIAVRAARYNTKVYPSLLELWTRSFMCSRCGEIFSIRLDHSR